MDTTSTEVPNLDVTDTSSVSKSSENNAMNYSTNPTPTMETTTNINPPKKNNTLKIVLVVIAILLICCIVLGIAAYTIAKNATNSAVSQINDAISKEDKRFSVTVNKVTQDGDNIILDLNVQNTLSDKATFSTLLDLTLVNDSGKEYSQDYTYAIPENQKLDGEIAGNANKDGRIAYSVSGTQSSLTLKVKSNLLSDKTINIKVR